MGRMTRAEAFEIIKQQELEKKAKEEAEKVKKEAEKIVAPEVAGPEPTYKLNENPEPLAKPIIPNNEVKQVQPPVLAHQVGTILKITYILKKSDDNLLEVEINPGKIKEFNIFKFYTTTVMPIITLKMVLKQEEHEEIINNIENVNFKLYYSISKDILSENDIKEFDDGNTTFLSEGCYVTTLIPNNVDKTRYKDTYVENNMGFTDVENILVELNLLPKESVKIQQKLYSSIYSDIKVRDICMNLLSDVSSNFFMGTGHVDEIENKETIKQLILPGKTFTQTMKYLQNVYGIYEHGMRLFLDLDGGYCLSNSNLNKNRTRRTKCMVSNKLDDITGFIPSNEENVPDIVVCATPLKIENNDTSNKLINGSSIAIQGTTQKKSNIVNEIQHNNDKLIEASKTVSSKIEEVNRNFNKVVNNFNKKKNQINSEINSYINKITGSINGFTDSNLQIISSSVSTVQKNVNKTAKDAVGKMLSSAIGANKNINIAGKEVNVSGVQNKVTDKALSVLNSNTRKLENTLTSSINSPINKYKNMVNDTINSNTRNIMSNINRDISKQTRKVSNLFNKEMGKISGIQKEIDNKISKVDDIVSVTINVGGRTIKSTEFLNNGLKDFKKAKDLKNTIKGIDVNNLDLNDVQKALNNPKAILSSGIKKTGNAIITPNKNTVSENLEDEISTKEKVLYKRFDNVFTETSKLAEESKNLFKITLTYKNVDPRMFNLDRVFEIEFLDNNLREYNGEYQILSMIISCSHLSERIFDSACTIQLCKLPKNFLASK